MPDQTAKSSESREERVRRLRSLIIHVMLMFLVAIVVFVIGTYFFVVPRMIAQNMEISRLQQQLLSSLGGGAAAEEDERLAEEEIFESVQSIRDKLQGCADTNLKEPAEVKVAFNFEITGEGKMLNLLLDPPDMSATPLGTCLLDHFRTLSFKPHDGETTSVTFPLTFRPTKLAN